MSSKVHRLVALGYGNYLGVRSSDQCSVESTLISTQRNV